MNLQETKKWASERFGIPEDDIIGYNHGICYDRILVTTKESANKVTAYCEGQTVNGGMFDGMPLGNQSHYKRDKNNEEYYDIMC